MEERTSIIYRLGNFADAKALGDLHYICSSNQPDAFVFKLGPRFLKAYYRIILKNPMSMVLCADAGKDGIVGLVAATLDAKQELEAVHRGKIRLLLAALPALLRRPSLIREVLAREKSLCKVNIGEGFIVGSGARLAFWGWLPNYPSKGQSLFLMQTCLKILKASGIETVQMEIDHCNRKVEAAHRFMGAKTVKEFTMHDGRKRKIMAYHMTGKGPHAPGQTPGIEPARGCLIKWKEVRQASGD